ncbi:hypothetical protein DUI87_09775 [Hirundo rustica rustica]|uniref:RNase H type-1 domain-containing protein n=1 Tax=Hirundo rustica rustica TaxID=333673 RepID=A0A3M0KGB4_HIRRU|nr:hypothetical protein DUI87_09775 [Hirundo rustica rustica]
MGNFIHPRPAAPFQGGHLQPDSPDPSILEGSRKIPTLFSLFLDPGTSSANRLEAHAAAEREIFSSLQPLLRQRCCRSLGEYGPGAYCIILFAEACDSVECSCHCLALCMKDAKFDMGCPRHTVLLTAVCVEISRLTEKTENFAKAKEKIFLQKAAAVKYSRDTETRVIYCRVRGSLSVIISVFNDSIWRARQEKVLLGCETSSGGGPPQGTHGIFLEEGLHCPTCSSSSRQELLTTKTPDKKEFKKKLPTLIGEQLAKDLESWEAPSGEGQLLQYVDNLLIATKTQEACLEWMVNLQNFLGLQGYCISQEKAQMVKQTVIYLGYEKGAGISKRNNTSLQPAKEGPHVSSSPGNSRWQSPKQLHAAAKGWPGCLRAIATVAVNIQEARKFTLGQKMTVPVSHTVSAVLKVKGVHWPSPQRFLKYQAILVEQDDVEIVVTNIVNPASFLSGSMGEPVIHDCLEAIKATYSSCPDLKDTLLENTETWSTDGSSYVISGRYVGYVVTTSREVIESGPLPTNTSAQKAEITALTWALELAKRKKVNIYTDLRYAFGDLQRILLRATHRLFAERANSIPSGKKEWAVQVEEPSQQLACPLNIALHPALVGLKKQITRFIERFIKRREHSKVLIEGVPLSQPLSTMIPRGSHAGTPEHRQKEEGWERMGFVIAPVQMLNSTGGIPKMC